MGDPLEVVGAQRRAVEQPAPVLVRGIGPVDREDDALRAEDHQRAQQRRQGEEAARGDVDVIEDVLGRHALEAGHLGWQVVVDAREHEGEHLAHVADHEPQLRMAIEDAAEHHAQDVQAGLRVPAPGGCAQEP